MNYDICGEFPVAVKKNKKRKISWEIDPEFWEQVDKGYPGLSNSYGVYVFAIRNGRNFTPWYVGRTENSFRKQVFNKPWLEKLDQFRGELNVFLIAPKKDKRDGFRKKYKKGRKPPTLEIKNLEFMLIGMALRENSELLNISIAEGLSKMTVPGVIHIERGRGGRPTKSEQNLKNALGLI